MSHLLMDIAYSSTWEVKLLLRQIVAIGTVIGAPEFPGSKRENQLTYLSGFKKALGQM